MSRIRIGELLGKMGTLSEHDIHEILEEQGASHHRFGDIALTWGLCQPEHIWKAWCNQLLDSSEKVELEAIGIDSQAVARVPRALAVRYRVMPVRAFEDQLVIAAAEPLSPEAQSDLSRRVKMDVIYVSAAADQIDRTIKRYYPEAELRSA